MEAFRIVITGRADPVFINALIEDVKNLTPEEGGYTFSYGTHWGGCTCAISPSTGRRYLDEACTVHLTCDPLCEAQACEPIDQGAE